MRCKAVPIYGWEIMSCVFQLAADAITCREPLIILRLTCAAPQEAPSSPGPYAPSRPEPAASSPPFLARLAVEPLPWSWLAPSSYSPARPCLHSVASLYPDDQLPTFRFQMMQVKQENQNQIFGFVTLHNSPTGRLMPRSAFLLDNVTSASLLHAHQAFKF